MNYRKEQIPKTAFDSLISNSQLDMMKVMVPYLPSSSQSGFAMMIRMQEMQETMRFYQTFPTGINSCDLSDENDNPSDILSAMRPYLPEQTGGMMDTMMGMMEMMSMFNGMQGSGNGSSMDMLKGMLSPEQQGMFDMMSMMNDLDADDGARDDYCAANMCMQEVSVEDSIMDSPLDDYSDIVTVN